MQKTGHSALLSARFTRLRSIELLQMQFSSSPSTFAGCTVDPEIASELLAFNHSDFVAHDQVQPDYYEHCVQV